MAANINPLSKYLVPGLLASAALAAILAATAANLSGFEITGKTAPLAYPWRLTEPNAMAHLTASDFYFVQYIIAWIIIYLARREKPKYGNDLRMKSSASLRWIT